MDPDWPIPSQSTAWSVYSEFISEMLADGLVTISWCLSLQRLRSGIRSRSTDDVLHALMTYSINSSLLTSLCALLTLVTYAALPNVEIFFAFYTAIPKLYINALLANLNVRESIQETLRQTDHESGDPTVIFRIHLVS